MEYKAFIIEHSKFILEKIMTSSKILTKEIEKIMQVSIEYTEIMCWDHSLAQIC